MARPPTGAITTGQCLQLKVKDFAEYLKDTNHLKGSISWTTGASIGIELQKEGREYLLNLTYIRTEAGKENDINSRIEIVPYPSNLGKGMVYYFLCPLTFKPCRVLYMGYGSHYFKSREAYNNRIYYPSQISSKLDRHNDLYWSLERRLEKVNYKGLKSHYRGSPTRTQKKVERMREKRAYHDKMRWITLPKKLQGLAIAYGLITNLDLIG